MYIPGPTHNNYQDLIKGNINVPIQSLALKILLQRLRMQYEANKKYDLKYGQELHDFFQKNSKLCEADIINIFK